VVSPPREAEQKSFLVFFSKKNFLLLHACMLLGSTVLRAILDQARQTAQRFTPISDYG
jgi:hypothetical protein